MSSLCCLPIEYFQKLLYSYNLYLSVTSQIKQMLIAGHNEIAVASHSALNELVVIRIILNSIESNGYLDYITMKVNADIPFVGLVIGEAKILP